MGNSKRKRTVLNNIDQEELSFENAVTVFLLNNSKNNNNNNNNNNHRHHHHHHHQSFFYIFGSITSNIKQYFLQ